MTARSPLHLQTSPRSLIRKLVLHTGTLDSPEAAAQRTQFLSRFLDELDEYLPHAAPLQQ